MKRSRILESDSGYLKVEFKSKFFKFKDYAEFAMDIENNLIHCRSYSKVGYYDFGVNRKRIESLRDLLRQEFQTQTPGNEP